MTLALAACSAESSAPAQGPATPSAAADPKPQPTPATAPPIVDACAAAQREGGPLRWFHDDYAGALACARSKSLPLMIDMWAPWCHTCLSMQAYVLTDERLADYDRRYVFLALDTDREANAAIVARFPPAAWPTFFAVSSHDESIQSRFVGAATVEQFASFLDDGERGHQATGGAALAAHEAAARDGDRASAAKQWGAAIDAYAKALATAPTPWSRAPDVMVSLLSAHNRDKRWAACPQVVRDHLPNVGNAASASDFSAMALACADAQADAQPGAQADAKAATELREAVVAKLRALVDDRAAPLSVDDRSDALMYLREALDALGRGDEAREAAMRQRVMLDEAAGDAKDPRIAMTYNWPRAEVYAYLGVPLELVAALEQSVAALPDEYDPPYRLAWIYLQASKQPANAAKADDARTWAERAIARAYGPRKAKAQGLLAEIHRARGDVEAERAARADALATLKALPAAAQNPDTIAKAQADLDAVGKAG